MLRQFVFRFFSFFIILLVAVFLAINLSSYVVHKRGFEIYETDSNTLPMKKNTHYDIIFSGASNARNLSNYKNNLRLESILNKSITNIAQGDARCGINEQFFYLKYFYEKGNTVDQLVYILDPILMYSKKLPYASNTFNNECFSLDFLFSYLAFDSENKQQRIFEYIRSKLTIEWLGMRPNNLDSQEDVIGEVDSLAVVKLLMGYFNPDSAGDRFNKSCNTLEKEIQFVREMNTKVVFVIPPSVFGYLPGQDSTLVFVERMFHEHGVPFYDFSGVMKDPKYYYDHVHLNTNGVIHFMQDFMKPGLESLN